MTSRAASRQQVVRLIRNALELLDEADEEAVANYLRQAIASLHDWGPDEIDDPLAGESSEMTERAIVRAMGKTLCVLVAFMARQGIASIDELSQMLGLFSVVTAETDADAGQIIGCWAKMLGDAMPSQH
jgi:hypothetical protein